MPRSGARELIELGTSVQAMTAKLMGEEAKLLLKVEELTETTERLTQAQAQLLRAERMASVGRLAAGVAHEIGNPIAAIMGMLDLLLGGDVPEEAQRDFVQRMRKETDRIHTVLRDLLDFARPEERPPSGGAAPAPGEVRAVAADVVALVRTQKSFRDVRLDVEVEGDPHVVLPGPRLTQVLLNLVLNAGAAVADAGKRDGRVIVRARAGGDRVRIEVEDDGPGVAPEVRDRLFEPFVTTKEVGEGTGLGLAVCRGLVESAGGEIHLDATEPGKGARFVVSLPAA
ncbi:MAG TPA: HAMP domain-containing sensor histidine kinase [Polyangiaceae bacterium]